MIGDADTSSENDVQSPHMTVENLAEALTLHQEDIAALREIAPLVSTSPRRAKRFLSTYLVIRACAMGGSMVSARLGSNAIRRSQCQTTAFLYLSHRCSACLRLWQPSIRNKQHSDTGRTATIGTWLSEAVQTATVPEEQDRLQRFLNSEPSITTLPVDAVMRWLPLARPYLPLYLQDLQDHATGGYLAAEAHHETGESADISN